MNIQSILLLALVAVGLFFALRSGKKQKCHCSGDCSKCSSCRSKSLSK